MKRLSSIPRTRLMSVPNLNVWLPVVYVIESRTENALIGRATRSSDVALPIVMPFVNVICGENPLAVVGWPGSGV